MSTRESTLLVSCPDRRGLVAEMAGLLYELGANIMRAEVNYFQNNSTGGTFTFSNAPTALDGTNPGATGDPFASFLLGIPTGGTYQSSATC